MGNVNGMGDVNETGDVRGMGEAIGHVMSMEQATSMG